MVLIGVCILFLNDLLRYSIISVQIANRTAWALQDIVDHSNGASSQRSPAHRFTAVSPPPLALTAGLGVKQLHIRITFQLSTILSSLFCCQTLTTTAGALTLEQWITWRTCTGCKSGPARRSSPLTTVKTARASFEKAARCTFWNVNHDVHFQYSTWGSCSAFR